MEILDKHSGWELRKEGGLKYSIVLRKDRHTFEEDSHMPERIQTYFKIWQYEKDCQENLITNLELVLSVNTEAESIDEVVLTFLAGAAKNGNEIRNDLSQRIRNRLGKYMIIPMDTEVESYYQDNPSMDSFCKKVPLLHDVITSEKGHEKLHLILNKLKDMEEINKDANKRAIIIRNIQEALGLNFQKYFLPTNTPTHKMFQDFYVPYNTVIHIDTSLSKKIQISE